MINKEIFEGVGERLEGVEVPIKMALDLNTVLYFHEDPSDEERTLVSTIHADFLLNITFEKFDKIHTKYKSKVNDQETDITSN